MMFLAAYTHRCQFKRQSQMSRARRGSFGSAEFCRDADYSFTYALENRDRSRVGDCLLIRVGNKTKELSCHEFVPSAFWPCRDVRL